MNVSNRCPYPPFPFPTHPDTGTGSGYPNRTLDSSRVQPLLGFVFDREGRDKTQREDLDRESGGLVAFTSRRMYENYLLNPCAIAHVASGIDGFREDGDVSAEEVKEWIEEHGCKPEYCNATVEGPIGTDPLWLSEVDGAKVLKNLFAGLSETRVAYAKVVHGVAITRWLCDNASEDLEERQRP